MSFNYYQLKYIALFTMIIDHATIIFQSCLSPETYYILRGVGRLSFPIYCFLLAEGFFHTRDRIHYLKRLMIFAIISEIPFDLTLQQGYLSIGSGNLLDILHWEHQNVFFTLAWGFISMLLMEAIPKRNSMQILGPLGILLAILSAEYLYFDYGAAGVLTILLFYLYLKNQENASFPLIICFIPLVMLSLSSSVQLACLLSLLPIWLYNGKKGQGPKYLFYIAYPAHLLICLGIFLLIY
ncbi:MAG: TraX family protein [Eubacteriales bacterium]|nr:TraX family protein [Eubacteriales bacterium]